MGRHTRFEGIVRGMVEVLDCPLTVKMRTGILKKNWNAHKLAPKLRDWGVSMATVSQKKNKQHYCGDVIVLCRSMAGHGSSATRNWQTGTTSRRVWK